MTTEMRRKDRQLTDAETQELLTKGEYGVLSTISPDGTPYGVPMSYAVISNVIYMHCSSAGGQRLTNIAHCSDACFTIINQVQLLPDKFATKYLSAIVDGKISVVTDDAEKRHAMVAILQKYSSEFMEKGLHYLDAAIDKIEVLRFDIVSMTGKGRKK